MKENHIKKTGSLCPECLKILDAELFERDGKVWIRKKCLEHGEFSDLYYGDYEMYKRAMKWAHDGKGIDNPATEFRACPMDCGLCDAHKSHTALANTVVTNRCDLACFYCFFYAKAMGYLYEPTLPQIRLMFKNLRQERPVATNAIQLTGGEPTIREDIVDIVRVAKEEGFDHVQLNTNGIRMSQNPELVKMLRSAGVNTLYLSFDGVTAKTNPKNHWEIPRLFRNVRETGMGVVLVPTVINGVNDHELGDIIRFGIRNLDIVRGVNFQPVSLVGRITKADREKFRITIPDAIKRIEEQTNGEIARDDWYPVPTVTAITHFIEALSGRGRYELTAHPVCGMATYVFMDNGKPVPITRFVDVDGMMEYLNEKADDIKGGRSKLLVGAEMLFKLKSFIDSKRQPKDLNLANILFNIFKNRDYGSLRELQHKSLFLGMMHFQDLYNYDIERVKRCCIHYSQPDGTIVPFCAFNVIPQWYRDKVQRRFSSSIEDWEKATGKKLSDDFYKRDEKKLESEPIYKETYSK
ncbi:MAG: radical SAM protein [Candidatus Aenigmatarchaeota archaeon]